MVDGPKTKVSKVMEASRVSKEVLIKDKECSSYVSSEPVSDTRGAEECYSPGQINLKGDQITRLSCDVDPSNMSMLEMKSFGAVNI